MIITEEGKGGSIKMLHMKKWDEGLYCPPPHTIHLLLVDLVLGNGISEVPYTRSSAN